MTSQVRRVQHMLGCKRQIKWVCRKQFKLQYNQLLTEVLNFPTYQKNEKPHCIGRVRNDRNQTKLQPYLKKLFHFLTANNNDHRNQKLFSEIFLDQNFSKIQKKFFFKNFENLKQRKMDSSFAETIPNATIDTSMSEPQVGSHPLVHFPIIMTS